jgi:hypothetical protein
MNDIVLFGDEVLYVVQNRNRQLFDGIQVSFHKEIIKALRNHQDTVGVNEIVGQYVFAPVIGIEFHPCLCREGHGKDASLPEKSAVLEIYEAAKLGRQVHMT